MKKVFLFLAITVVALQVNAQVDSVKADTSWAHEYREAATRINDLVHTKLDVKFDFNKSYLYGKAWITFKPHFYATDSLTLDAKGMDIKKVALAKNGKNTPLKYEYNGSQLHIKLDKQYQRTESYIIYAEYT